ncbi:hypothetical protein SLS62_001445 [Diatrype stigma]|uniref:Uncharacterized protein n=1 Tax=Diatrype stigma TaxID=117547 RepID=A0AAN9VAL6_9PEZI
MAKGKNKAAGSVPNRPIYSRISYLYQAAAYLSSTSSQNHEVSTPHEAAVAQTQTSTDATEESKSNNTQSQASDNAAKQAVSRRLLSDLRACSLKTQIRLSPSMKQTICKYCDTLLIEGDTSTSVVENQSKGGKKPWADVLVVKCNTCGGVKRFPVQAPRQQRRPVREARSDQKPQDAAAIPAKGG